MELNSEQAEFNSGLAIIYQLDAIEKGLVNATVNKNYDDQFSLLVSYFKTLYPHMKSTKKKGEDFDERDKHLKMWEKVKDNYKKIKEAKKNGMNKIPCALLDEFDYWELELRDIKQKLGLGMPKRDLRFAMGGG